MVSATDVLPRRAPTVVTSRTTGVIRVRVIPLAPEVVQRWNAAPDTTGGAGR